MSYTFYKILHITGLASLLIGLGLGIAYFILAKASSNKSLRIWTFVFHGVGLALILVSGFGLLARLGLVGAMPTWIYGKLAIWGLMAVMISIIKRKAGWFPATALVIIALVGYAASLALTKTF